MTITRDDFRRVVRRGFLGGGALAAGLLFIGTALADEVGPAPDMIAYLINGPGQVHVGQTVETNVTVLNDGAPFTTPYTVEIVLSTDLFIDPGDLVLETMMFPVVGPFPVDVTIPMSLTPGYYYWGFRVLPHEGEVILDNNAIQGLKVIVYKTALTLDDESPIEAFARPTDTEFPYDEIAVSNTGSEGSVLMFVVLEQPPVGWLTVDPKPSFAYAGQSPNVISLYFDHTGLPLGQYTTTLRFQNLKLAYDYVEVPVRLTVGEAWFAPGSKIMGDIEAPHVKNKIVFDGIKKERVFFRVRTNSGDLKPKLTIVDPDGKVEEVLKFPHSGDGKFIGKSHKLGMNGLYTLYIGGQDGTTGAYRIRTRRALPPEAHSRTVKVRSPLVGDPGYVPVRLLPEAYLAFTVKPNDDFTGPPVFSFEDPTHASVPVFGAAGAQGNYLVLVPPMDSCGRHLLWIDGFGADPKEKLIVSVYIKQPKKGKAKIILP